jgi:hypothetical protein
MRLTLIFIALSLLLTACSRRAQIVGTWHKQSGAVAFVFNSDGSFSSGESNHYAGTWQISDKILTMTLTNATGPHPNGKVGDTVQYKVRVDSHVLSFMAGGQTVSFSR